ncbi:hypothetical protein V5799_019269 [Amblyomma americanum]|uniref:Secreted protein n=1 Tax=Amblyomma americanum TaxID=6943 RepID=A0AAQ4EXC9_AMBAM
MGFSLARVFATLLILATAMVTVSLAVSGGGESWSSRSPGGSSEEEEPAFASQEQGTLQDLLQLSNSPLRVNGGRYDLMVSCT